MNRYKSLPIFLAFLAMGFGDAIGPFVGLAKEQFALSHFEAQLIAFTGFIMFGLLSVPVGLLQDRKGRKVILMAGLSIALAGMLIPLFGLSRYALFLLTILLLGAGAATLQVAGNPIMRDVSPPGKYARNLSLAQFIKAIGSLSGSLIPFAAARWMGLDWMILFPIYASALLLSLIILGLTRIEELQQPDSKPASLISCLSLMRNPMVAAMVAGIFLYVGAEVSVSSGIPILLSQEFGIDLQTRGLLGNSFFFVSIITGRFLGAIILNYLPAMRFFRLSSMLSLFGLGLMFSPLQPLVLTGILLCGLGFANVFPLIFSLTVDAMPERSNEVSGLMVTAIVGGAFLPPLMGLVADLTGPRLALAVPLAAMFYVSYLAWRTAPVTK